MANQPTAQNLPLPIFNAMVPPEGPKEIPLLVDLTVIQAYLVDLTNIQAQGKISFIQGAYVDNSLNGQKVTLVCQGTNMSVTIPANSQGFVPLLFAQNPAIYVSSTGGVVIPIKLLNVPMPAIIWGVNGAGAVTITGTALVQDVALEALIANLGGGNGLGVNVLSGGGGGGSTAGGLILNTQLSSNAGVNSALAGAGKFWYVTGVDISLSSDFTAPAVNSYVHVWAAGGIAVFAQKYFKPTAAAPGLDVTLYSPNIGAPIIGDIANDRVQVQTSIAAVTTGFINVNVWGYAK